MNFLNAQRLVKIKEFAKALKIFQNLELNNIKDKRILFYLGLIYFELNNYQKSIDYYNKYLKVEPNSIGALLNLAIVKQSVGDLDEAKKIYQKIIKLDKNNIRSYYGLFTLNSRFLTKNNFEHILKIKDNSNFNDYEKGIISFLLSKNAKLKKNYNKEIKYLKTFHLNIFNSNYNYNLSSQFYYNKIISGHYNKVELIENNACKTKCDEFSPIFIIGLPRSGSTLMESILTSSNKKLDSFGECHVVNMSVIEQVGKEIYIENFDVNKFTYKINIADCQDSILNRYKEFNTDNNQLNKIFIDKSLENFFNIEIILKIFPKAKFIHTFRNLSDSIISIYQSMLPELSWTHSVENILIYINNYLRVIDYFKKKYPESIIDINLEKFTENHEIISKKIYKFCNLDWHDKVLQFYNRDDLYSKTLSFTQIRKKISKYNKSRYQPYYHLFSKYKIKYHWLNS